ncbi:MULTISPECIES: glycine zipper 2TM domain-containing protein [unclassified Massilia]|uniref:glycine zipper 2TM domain-containing protein n=1 Tax=unclassified Massilia TaxID=2609279 RepID=UPI00177BE3FE|nr:MULTISPECIES: glycine zipper 2TM domain-containing protein [unclassified Massilia]MBD8532209.1 glycine zipper 2TM domain-containing protein [Massilia sp. CFBP 13647]MBD8675716.1 glycine zipper 2TM domain-containing protein [Massilia sp. CFBP 13721]
MKAPRTFAAAAVAAVALLSGCASSPSYNSGNNGGYNNTASMGYGTIESIQVTQAENRTSGGGAVVGALVGALAGNQVGSGSGRTAATVAGGVGGALVGNNIEKNRNAGSGQEMYQVNVRMDNGEYRTVVQDSVYDLRVGNRVRLVDGRVYRY